MLIQATSSFLGCSSDRENMATAGARDWSRALHPTLHPEWGSHHLCARSAVTGPQDWAVCPVRPQGVRFEGGHYVCLLLLLSRQVVSDSLRPHGRQHARLPCPSPSPNVCPSSCPLNRWCHLTIPSSLAPIPLGRQGDQTSQS